MVDVDREVERFNALDEWDRAEFRDMIAQILDLHPAEREVVSDLLATLRARQQRAQVDVPAVIVATAQRFGERRKRN